MSNEQQIQCPFCNKNQKSTPLKIWTFGKCQVKRFECSSCSKKFNFYHNSVKSWTIPKKKTVDVK